MPKKTFTTEQIINKLRKAEVMAAQGQTVPAICREIGVTDQTYYRWRKEYGGLKLDQAKRLKELEKENGWLKRLVADRTRDGRAIRILNVIDEYTRECLASMAERKITASDVIGCLAELFLAHGLPEHIRSDNGPEFTAKSVRRWLEKLGARTLFIEPGSPWENGYIESFNGKMRDELLNGEIFDTLLEAKVLIERWRVHYNGMRPHSSLGYRPPAPEAILTSPLEMPLLLPEPARGST